MAILRDPAPLALLPPPRRRILRRLRAADRTVTELAAEFGVTPNAVRGHLVVLERDELVMVVVVRRESVGKPARLYRLTTSGEELFPRGYAALLLAVLDLLAEWDGGEGVAEVMRSAGARAAGAQRTGAVAAAERAFHALGVEVAVDVGESEATLDASGCPLAAAVVERPELCRLVAALVSGGAGTAVRAQCDRTGGRPRCRFAFSLPESSAAW